MYIVHMYFISGILLASLFMKTSLACKIVAQLSTYCRAIQPTTSNNSCDGLTSNQL